MDRRTTRTRAERGKILLAVGLAVALCPLTCRQPEPPPNVLILLLDTLRADRLGAYGNKRGLTPFLDELAARGAVFRNTASTSSWTIPAVISLFTSRYPSQHGVTNYHWSSMPRRSRSRNV